MSFTLRGIVRSIGVGLVSLLAWHDPLLAATYRCEVDGRVLYRDRPCEAGKQSNVVADDPVSASDRAEAIERARRDRAALAQLDRDHAREREEDRRAAALARRAQSDRSKQVQACAKLARRVRDARDAYDIAGPRDQPKTRSKMQHAEADFAALCKH